MLNIFKDVKALYNIHKTENIFFLIAKKASEFQLQNGNEFLSAEEFHKILQKVVGEIPPISGGFYLDCHL